MPKQLSLDNVDIPDDVAQAYQSEEKHISNGFLSDLAGPPREQRSGHTIFANTKFKIASLALLGVAAAAVGAVTYTQLYADNTKHCVGDCQKADLNSKMHNGIMEERNALYDATWAARPKTKSRLPVTVEGPFNCVDGMASTFPCSGTDILSIVPVQNFGFNDGPTDDVWAWVDPQDGREYALVSVYEGFVIIDVSNPYNPKTIISILSPSK